MGNIQSSNIKKTEDTKNSLLKKMDIIAANYITTLNIDEMTNLIDKEKCGNIEIFTKNEFEKKFSFVDIQYLRQRQEHGIVKNHVDNAEVIIIPKKEDLRPRELTRKHRLCEGIAKYYIKLGQVYSSIVKTLNPIYASDVNEIDIFDLYNVGINDLEENDKKNNNPKKFDNLCDKRIRLLFQIVDKYNEQLKELDKEKSGDVVIDNSELKEISTQLGGDMQPQMMQQVPQPQMMQQVPQSQMMQQSPQTQMMQQVPQPQMMQQVPQPQMMQQVPQPQMMQQVPQPVQQMTQQVPQPQMSEEQYMEQPQLVEQQYTEQPQLVEQQYTEQPQLVEQQYTEQPQLVEQQYMEQPQMSEEEVEQSMEQPQMSEEEVEQSMEQPQMSEEEVDQYMENIISPVDLNSLNNLNIDEGLDIDDNKPGICKINENMNSLYEEVGISELEELFKDKYDYENSKYVMSDSSKSKYIELVKKFQETFSGKELNNSILSKITNLFSFGNNTELEAKSFKDIKLVDFNKELDSCKREVNFDYESDETKLLFIEYAEHLKNMLYNTREFYKQLKDNLKKLFEFIEDTKTGEVYPMVHRNLTEVKLNSIAETTRVVITELYLTCNKDFTKGLELYKKIIYTQLLNRDLNRIDNLEKDMENTVIEEQQPEEEVEEQVPQEDVAVEEQAPQEEVAVEEQAPQEEVAVEEQAPQEEVAVEEQQPEEEVAVEEQQPEEEVVVEEQQPEEEVVVEEQQPEEEVVVEEQQPQIDSSSIKNTNSNTESLDSLKISTLDESENKEKQNQVNNNA
jgi:hypothetical protein